MTLALILIIIILIIIELIQEIKKRKQRKQLREEENKQRKIKREYCEYYIIEIKSAQSLIEVFLFHKLIWALDLKNQNIGPNEFGMFRTKNILKMHPDEIFLGNINGLWTKSVSDWEPYKDNDPEIYKTILDQYKKHLISNLTAIKLSL